jgi:hypothetical protein
MRGLHDGQEAMIVKMQTLHNPNVESQSLSGTRFPTFVIVTLA